jgi:hypothetical protein
MGLMSDIVFGVRKITSIFPSILVMLGGYPGALSRNRRIFKGTFICQNMPSIHDTVDCKSRTQTQL